MTFITFEECAIHNAQIEIKQNELMQTYYRLSSMIQRVFIWWWAGGNGELANRQIKKLQTIRDNVFSQWTNLSTQKINNYGTQE